MRRTAMVLLASCLFGAGTASAAQGLDHLTEQHWLQEADRTANDQVTYEICGWGFIDLRIPFLRAADEAGATPRQFTVLATRFDTAIVERRRLEALMAINRTNRPPDRLVGIHATGGCASDVLAGIGRRAAIP